MLFLSAFLALPGSALAATHWVSPDGAAGWSACESDLPLSGTAACSLATANANAAAGDTVYLRGGTYTVNANGQAALSPSNSGSCASAPCKGGVGASRITFAAYAAETPVLTQANATIGMIGLALHGRSWVRVTGITFMNFTLAFAVLDNGASYNEIDHNKWIADPGYYSLTGGRGFVIGAYSAPWSVHNWIHHNYISKKHNIDPCGEATDLARIGNAQTPDFAADNYTTWDNNYQEYGGHSTLVTYSKYNVVRGNVSHNEPWIAGCLSYDGSVIDPVSGTTRGSASSSSASIGTGSKTFTIAAGLSETYWKAPLPVAVFATSDVTQTMNGNITSYNLTTGEIVINVTYSTGSGTYTSWVVHQRNVPYYTNAAYNGLYGHRNFGLGDEDLAHPNYNLAEGNRLGFGGINPNNLGATNLDVGSPNNIVRYNFVYGAMSSGMGFKNTVGGNPPTSGGVNNRMYNNTSYHNGYGYDPSMYSGSNSTWSGQGIAQYCSGGCSGGKVTGNVVKNNLVYGNRLGAICQLGFYKNGTTPCSPAAYDTVSNNWVDANGDPKFSNASLTDPTNAALPNLGLQASSPAIDGGTHLTQANGTGTDSTTLVADDAFYFQDGTWGSDLARGVTFFPDWIAIGTVTNVVQISSINYAANTITLASPMTWADRAPIWLYKKSDGATVLVGAGPDFGASEFGASGPAAPTGVRIIR